MKSILIILFSFSLLLSNAQDIMIFKDGSEMEVKVVQINSDNVLYKKFNNLEGPDYTELKQIIFMIKYENGSKDIFKEDTERESKENPQEINNNYVGKEISYYDGVPIISYSEKDAVIAMSLRKGRQYGKYYVAEIMIFNNSGKKIDFVPKNFIYPTFINRGIASYATIMSFEEYNKKVKNYQAWRAFAVGFANAYSASQAGYSNSQTSGSVYGYGTSSTNASAYGYGGGNSWSAYGSSQTNSSINLYGSSNTTTYDGGKAYAANQNAAKNSANFVAYQNIERKQIKYEYLKRHTLKNGEEISGKINIPFQEAEIVEIAILLNGNEYIFDFTDDLILELND